MQFIILTEHYGLIQMQLILCRYFLVEKAKDANMIGILVGTLGVGMFPCMFCMENIWATEPQKFSNQCFDFCSLVTGIHCFSQCSFHIDFATFFIPWHFNFATTLAAGYLHMIHQMKELITKAGKKAYTFVMGRPNPAKLANFPEVFFCALGGYIVLC